MSTDHGLAPLVTLSITLSCPGQPLTSIWIIRFRDLSVATREGLRQQALKLRAPVRCAHVDDAPLRVHRKVKLVAHQRPQAQERQTWKIASGPQGNSFAKIEAESRLIGKLVTCSW